MVKAREALALTKEGKQVISNVATAISRLASVNQNAADRARHISGISVQRSSGVRQIASAMERLKQVSQDTSVASGEMERAVAKLQAIGEKLQQFLGE